MIEVKGKPLSLTSKMIAVAMVCGAVCAEVVTGRPVPINDVIKAAIFIMLVFAPVDISLWVETFLAAFSDYKANLFEKRYKEDLAA